MPAAAIKEVEAVNWDLVDERIPIALIPEQQQERRKLFNILDSNKNGKLTLSEVQSGLPHILENPDRARGAKSSYVVPLKDLKPAIKCAFKEAKSINPEKGKRFVNSVDRAEFHGLLYAFRLYVELDVIFQAIDRDEDQMLNWKDCQKVLSLLEDWNITAEQAKSKFPDEWTPSLDYEDFAEWCITRKLGDLELVLDENDPEDTLQHAAGLDDPGKLLASFEKWDTDGSGWISAEELKAVLLDLDSSFTEAQADKLFAAADANKDGKIDYAEFTAWATKDLEKSD
mmetsp:Transcript_42385/g.76084  ORF Transcript_42385/g.76084 Transcript_42385/m.76084 type:complete len:285 (-) Transcript_42385:294-1148(-)|eukprot:CAMPEP_0197654394 /NCGR_PEP_ID=MMETSP1338-20131121/38827_1 /TAXON_ID=43686 ORGANISM="Pelagodinium beii, Strain RCC1491" /NCGR_SAMPLE_ID=MMETSP1338 /ASSEMBLY_ACC=CAM_ASM_000754 /LENGTH=284 /DNA_ID=CAMNT_0043229837 /DNA_START=54 /DNA_END=908 /DNA_ORIENTATION=-